ncbi:nickel pincer cofactor biosynthesis protein LarC [Methanococcoides sp. SA1]|nr:nickel pincer cofactor biosynthesis protein LarC [Methanococcoides sp. SA1]
MRTLVFEPFSGASGDMILAGLIDLGADREEIVEVIQTSVDVSVTIEDITKCGIHATDVHIHTKDSARIRSFGELIDIMKDAKLPKEVEKNAIAVFRIIGEAEAKVHGIPLEQLHFHEVGQDDALADVIGSCYAIHRMKVENILCTSVNVGGGRVRTAHGTLPVPAPATTEILSGSGLEVHSNGDRELLTPTGAAILTYFANPSDQLPPGKIMTTGYGAGDADTDMPNVLRTMIMETTGTLSRDHMEVLETNVDDVTGEVLGTLFETLMKEGAKDVAITPATMKKGRTGHIIHVIAHPENSERIARELIRQTGTLGVRILPTKHRFIAERKIENVNITIGKQIFQVAVKIAHDRSDEVLHISAEFEDCKQISQECGLPLKEVIRRAEEKAWNDILKK